MTISVIRIRQKAYVRSTGVQLVSWAVTVPVADPAGTPLIATAPVSCQPLFVIRQQQVGEALQRIARLEDFESIPQAEARYLDVRGAGGDVLFAPTAPNGPLGPFVGDELSFDLSGSLSHWCEDQAPYDTGVFQVRASAVKGSGLLPQVLPGNQLVLPGYSFKSTDVNRWVNLTGFASSSYNGLTRILGYQGNVATVSKTTTTSETGAAWTFPWVEIETRADPTLEPRYFPKADSDIAWSLRRLGTTVIEQPSGAFPSRGSDEALVRSVRCTMIAPDVSLAQKAALVIQNGAFNLAQKLGVLDTEVFPLKTLTYGV